MVVQERRVFRDNISRGLQVISHSLQTGSLRKNLAKFKKLKA